MVTATLIFANPGWIIAIPVVGLGSVFFWRIAQRYKQSRIALFVGAGLLKDSVSPVSRRAQLLRFCLPVAIILLLILAAARPLIGPRPGHADRKGVDFVVALDVSKSMWAEDVQPNRLDAIKKELSEWFKTMAGDRMGLVLFAGDAVIQAPITFDYQALDRVLKEATPKAISKGGTNIGQSIEMATTLLKKSGLDTRALVIVSDGENLDGDALAAARTAREKDGLTIFTVGVGTEAGSKVPVTDYAEAEKMKRRQREYIRNEYGTEVTSQLDEHALRSVAAAGGGQYETFVPNQQFFPRFRDTHLMSLAKSRKILNVQDYYEWFQLPLALAILLLVLEPFLTAWKRRSVAQGVGVKVIRPTAAAKPAGAPVQFAKKAARPKVGTAILLFGLLTQAAFSADTLQDQVEKLLKEKKTDDAVALMKQRAEKNPDNLLLVYNYGITLYQAGRFEDAITAFQSVEAAPNADEAIRTQALLQLGNAQFRLGNKLGTQPAAALSMERALAFYDQLLAQKSTSDGKHNREATVQALEGILRSIADDRLRSADEQIKKNGTQRLSKTLKEAADALDRMVQLDPSNLDLVREATKTHERLAQALMAEAAKLSAEADKLEAANDQKNDRKVLGQRAQTIDIQKEAQNNSPKDQHIQDAIKEQQNKMADLLTKRAEEKVAPVLAKPTTDGKDMDALNRARKDLQSALEAAPDHAKAKDLKAKTDQKLEAELLRQGNNALAGAERPNADPHGQLRSAMGAADAFQKALEVNADSQPAKAGMEKLATLLPKLHAEVGAMDLADAKKLLGDKNDAAKDAQAKPAAASPDDLKKAVGYLETSTQNFSRAVELAPTDADAQKGLDEAQKLLSDSRDSLDKRRQSEATAEAKADSDDGKNSQQASALNAPNTQVYSTRQPKAPPSVTSGAFWNKNVRDW